MLEDILKSHIGTIITGFAGGFFGWFFTRRKQLAMAKSTELENVEKSLSIYRQMVKDLKQELDDMRERAMYFEKKLQEVETELSKYKAQQKCCSKNEQK